MHKEIREALTAFPLLTKEEEIRLITLYKQGDIQARNKIVEANTRLAFAMAAKYTTRSFPIDEAFCVGVDGLYKAIDGFDVTRGVRFSTYACRVILSLLNNDWTRRKKHNEREKSGTLSGVTRTGDFYDEESRGEFGEGCGINRSLQVPFFNNYYKEIEKKAKEAVETATDVLSLLPLLDKLRDKDQDIIRAVYGMPPYTKPMTLSELAERDGVSKQRVSQRKLHALQVLRELFDEEMAG